MITDEQSKAVAEVAKTTREAVKAAGGVGAYLGGVIGSIPEDLFGLAGGDWLHHRRLRTRAVLEVNTRRFLEGVSPDRLTEPSPSVIIPLLQAAVDDRPELQALWAALLANAMIDGGHKVRRDYFDALRQMEPVDALYLQVVTRTLADHSLVSSAAKRAGAFNPIGDLVRSEAERASINPIDRAIAEMKLIKLGCLPQNFSIACGLEPFGRGLMAALSVD